MRCRGTTGSRNKVAAMPPNGATRHMTTKLLKIKIKLKYFSKELPTIKSHIATLKKELIENFRLSPTTTIRTHTKQTNKILSKLKTPE